MGCCSYRSRCGQKARFKRIQCSKRTGTTTNRGTAKTNRSITTTTKTTAPTTAPTTAGRPHSEVEKICGSQTTRNNNRRRISESQGGPVIKDLSYRLQLDERLTS